MALAALAFTIMIAAVKVARAEMSSFELIAYRSVVSVPIAAVYCWRGGIFAVKTKKVFAVRTLLGFGAMVGYFTASKAIPLADLSLITKLQPILLAIAAPLIMGATERVGVVVWTALVLGLVGCGILIGPELSSGASYGAIALGATSMSAGAHLAVRHMGHTESPRAIVLWFQVALFPLALLGHALVFGGLPGLPPPHLLGWVLLSGVMATVGQVLMTNAYRFDRAAIVAAASYTAPIWAVGLDFAIFATTPSTNVWIGGALVVVAGFLVVRDKAAA